MLPREPSTLRAQTIARGGHRSETRRGARKLTFDSLTSCLPEMAAIAQNGIHPLVGNEPVVSLPAPRQARRRSRAMSVGTTPMIAIPVAAFMGPRAMIVGQTPQARCNDFGHDPPMIAIPGSDDCDPLYVE